MEYKYTAKFESVARNTITPSFKESKASANDLKYLHTLFPDKAEMIKDDGFLTYISYVVGLTSYANKNGHALSGATAVALKPSWAKRPFNVDHERNNVIGVIINSGFARLGSNEIIEQPDNINLPFRICNSAYLWDFVAPSAVEMIKDSDKEGSSFFREIGTSWEIGFNSMKLFTGSKNLSRATIISDPEEVEAKRKFLQCEGGEGMDDEGNEIYMLIDDVNAVILGTAATFSPASQAAKGITVFTESDASIITKDDKSITANQNTTTVFVPSVEISTPKQENISESAKIEPIIEIKAEKVENNENKISQKQEKSLNHTNPIMYKNLTELYASLSTAGVATEPVRELLEKTLKEAGEKYSQDETKRANEKDLLEQTLAAVKEQKQAAEDAKVAAEAKSKEQAETLASLQKEIQEVKSAAAFQARIDSLAEKYDLNDKVIKALASVIKDQSEDEYKVWLDSDLAKVIFASYEKKVEVKDKVDEVIENLQEAKASTEGLENKQKLDDEPVTIKFQYNKKQ